MPNVEHPMQALTKFLPGGTFEPVVHYIHYYKVHLTVTKKRKSILGDYRHSFQGKNHRISINGNLNKYEFLITLLHELAHLLTYEQFGNKVEAHGKHWKANYSQLLINFVQQNIFPSDIKNALQKSILNPAATANGETELLLVLRKYEEVKKEGYHTIAELPVNAIFQTEKGKLFRKGIKRRVRYECIEVRTNLRYSFSAITVVKWIQQE